MKRVVTVGIKAQSKSSKDTATIIAMHIGKARLLFSVQP